MKRSDKSDNAKRTQKDYSLSFKLQLVEEVEKGFLTKTQAKHKYGIQGDSTVTKWLQKYGNFDWENQVPKTKIKLLEKQKARAEHLAERADKKVIIFDMLVNMAEKEYDIQIRKNYTPDLSISSKKNTKKL